MAECQLFDFHCGDYKTYSLKSKTFETAVGMVTFENMALPHIMPVVETHEWFYTTMIEAPRLPQHHIDQFTEMKMSQYWDEFRSQRNNKWSVLVSDSLKSKTWAQLQNQSLRTTVLESFPNAPPSGTQLRALASGIAEYDRSADSKAIGENQHFRAQLKNANNQSLISHYTALFASESLSYLSDVAEIARYIGISYQQAVTLWAFNHIELCTPLPCFEEKVEFKNWTQVLARLEQLLEKEDGKWQKQRLINASHNVKTHLPKSQCASINLAKFAPILAFYFWKMDSYRIVLDNHGAHRMTTWSINVMLQRLCASITHGLIGALTESQIDGDAQISYRHSLLTMQQTMLGVDVVSARKKWSKHNDDIRLPDTNTEWTQSSEESKEYQMNHVYAKNIPSSGLNKWVSINHINEPERFSMQCKTHYSFVFDCKNKQDNDYQCLFVKDPNKITMNQLYYIWLVRLCIKWFFLAHCSLYQLRRDVILIEKNEGIFAENARYYHQYYLFPNHIDNGHANKEEEKKETKDDDVDGDDGDQYPFGQTYMLSAKVLDILACSLDDVDVRKVGENRRIKWDSNACYLLYGNATWDRAKLSTPLQLPKSEKLKCFNAIARLYEEKYHGIYFRQKWKGLSAKEITIRKAEQISHAFKDRIMMMFKVGNENAVNLNKEEFKAPVNNVRVDGSNQLKMFKSIGLFEPPVVIMLRGFKHTQTKINSSDCELFAPMKIAVDIMEGIYDIPFWKECSPKSLGVIKKPKHSKKKHHRRCK